MPIQEPEAGPTWGERAALPGFAGVLDAADIGGAKNDFIDRIQKAALGRAVGRVRGRRVLDVGCGNGRLTAWLAARGAKVVGVDASETMVEEARRHYPTAELVVGDAEELPFEAESFDAALSVGVLQYLAPDAKRLGRAATEIARVVRRGGRFIALEQVHDGGLPRGASRAEYAAAFVAAGFDVRSSTPIRVGDSSLMSRALARPNLARLPVIPFLIRAEARRQAKNLTDGRYADQLIICVRR